MVLGQMICFAKIRNSALSFRLEGGEKWIALRNQDLWLIIVLELATSDVYERSAQVEPNVRTKLALSTAISPVNSHRAWITLFR